MPSLELERAIQEELGLTLIAGIDEAGRGAIAGPVVAAAVILPLNQPRIIEQLEEVNDSKQISPKRREVLFDLIMANALTYGVACSSASEIDECGILPANAMAMQAAVAKLAPAPEFLLLDGRMRLKNLTLPQKSIIRGDGLSLSIAAASILAKVSRDRHMVSLDGTYPKYEFARHKGYCTRAHVAALGAFGPCQIHRYSFAPIRQTLI
jgi:ribonuclease HII